MSDTNIEATVRRLLQELWPEVDLASVTGDADLREELDIDSMDFLNFAIVIHDATEIEIPEDDYAELMTLDECIAYLEDRQAA
jgi:acyl carrier protein